MTDDQWRTQARLLIAEGKQSIVMYIDQLRIEIKLLKENMSKPLSEVLKENERLVKMISELRKKK